MRYRVNKHGFLERFVRQAGRGEVWQAMECYRNPQIRTDQHDRDGNLTGYTETMPCHCGNWCPLFELGYLSVSLHCGNARTISFVNDEKEGDEPC